MASESEPDSKKRPVGVWIITCFSIFALFLNVASMTYAVNNMPELFEQFSAFEMSVSLLTVIANLVAVGFLFMLRAISFWIFVGATIFSLTPMLVRLINGQDIIPDGPGSEGIVLKTLVWFAMLAYVWNLKVKGILK